MSPPPPPRLELSGVTKSYPGVRANDDIGFALAPGEILALLGENGAGKSTLVKIVYGLVRPDFGEIRFDGAPAHVASPREARARGIGMVFQHFSLFDALTVFENIALGLDEAVDRRELAGRIDKILAAYSLPLDLDRSVHTLSVGERQRIEIVRCLLVTPRLLIMDEPTSVLTPQEAERLFGMLRTLAREGCSILYISHKLREIKALCDRAVVLRGGRVVGECDPRLETTRRMAEMMIGGEFFSVGRDRRTAPDARPGVPRLSVCGLAAAPADPTGTTLRGVGFEVAAGEIFGIAGVAGNGQSELVMALAGEVAAPRAEMIAIDGAPVGRTGAAERRRRGLCTLPEERNGHAAVPDLSLRENGLLTARQRLRLSAAGFLKAAAARLFARRVIDRLAVKAGGPEAAAGSLSGGNLQKFVMGREILQSPDILVVAQPTWGVDAGAAAAIHRAILDLAAGGSAVVIVSQDLDELLALSDRLAVLNEGRLSEALPAADATPDRIGLLMGGVHGDGTGLPSPLRGGPSRSEAEDRGGGRAAGTRSSSGATPTPNPSPQGGGEKVALLPERAPA